MDDTQLYTAERITELPPNHIFVFGSNTVGHHGSGAALYAYRHFGASNGIGEGFSGQSYAIPTKVSVYNTEKKSIVLEIRSIDEIRESVNTFIRFVKARPMLVFHVTPIACGLAKYSPKIIGPLFKDIAGHPRVYLPKSFVLAIRGGN